MGQLISGKNSVLEAIKHKIPLKRIFVLKPLNIKLSPNVQIIITNKYELDKMTRENHQGYVAEMMAFNYHNIDVIETDKPQKILILDHITDPHNLGAIIRTANASGIKHLILPKDRAAQINATVLKVASGGQISLKIIRVNSLQSTIKNLKEKNHYWIYATTLSHNSVNINDVKTFNYPLVLIIGNEGKGVSNTLLKMSDVLIHIPMQGSVESLNVSVAAGIILFKI